MTPQRPLEIADLFCGAGGTSTGAIEAARALGYTPRLTAVNHWPTAVATHTLNHPDSRHVCASVDSINPRDLFRRGELDVLWASPECTHFSRARGGTPMSDQSRASAHCVARWAEAIAPRRILVENVREFLDWGPLGTDGKAIKARKGTTFMAWVGLLESFGYRVSWRILRAADYGDPTTRERLFVQAAAPGVRIVWPKPSHSAPQLAGELFGPTRPWRTAREIIDWSIPSTSIYERRHPLRRNTLLRIAAGLRRFGVRGDAASDSFLVPMDLDGPDVSSTEPFLLPQQSGGRPRPVSEPVPTISTSGAIALVEPFIVEYYGSSTARSVDVPLATVTTKQRFGLAEPTVSIDGRQYRLDIRFRMLQPHELAAAQGFPSDYRFSGSKADINRQIGNAVPRHLARAIVAASLSQDADVSWLN